MRVINRVQLARLLWLGWRAGNLVSIWDPEREKELEGQDTESRGSLQLVTDSRLEGNGSGLATEW